MTGIAISGLSSGLDTATLIEELMEIESQPLTDLETQKSELETEQTILRNINTQLSTLEDIAFEFSAGTAFDYMTATSSNESYVTATATDDALNGSYSVEVTSLAKQNVVFSDEANVDVSSLVGKSFKIYYGDEELEISITATGEDGSISTTNDDGSTKSYDELLADIADTINYGGVGITAAVVDVGNENYRLVLTSKDAGTDNAMVFGSSSSDTKTVFEDDGNLLAALGITSADGTNIDAENVGQEATDAEVTVNGITVTRSSNTISDIIDGVTLTLNGVGTSTVEVESDTEQIMAEIQSFVDAYNEVVSTIRTYTGEGGYLQGDSSLNTLSTQLYSWATSHFVNGEDGYQTLSQIGITIDEGITDGSSMTGTMTIDEETLQTKLEADPDALKQLFSYNGSDDDDTEDTPSGISDGIARYIYNNLDMWTNYSNGIMTTKISGYDSEISFIDDSIEQMEERLTLKEEQLTSSFTAMEVALSELNTELSYVSSLISSI